MFNVHLNKHFQQIEDGHNFGCPHPLCEGAAHHEDLYTLKVHFYDVHSLAFQGCTRSRGYKRTCDEYIDGEGTEDSDGGSDNSDDEITTWEGFSSGED